jgi:hypothetical protein
MSVDKCSKTRKKEYVFFFFSQIKENNEFLYAVLIVLVAATAFPSASIIET